MSTKPLTVRVPGLYDADAASLDSGLACRDPSLAIQSQKDESDINTIVKNFGLTGELPVSQRVPFPYDVDFDEILDYRTLADQLMQAQRSFNSLPAVVRATFANDAVAFADFASDPKNLDQMRAWGLAPPAPEPTPTASSGP